MRKAINNNPIVQIGLLGVLGVLVAVVFMSSMGGDKAPPPEEEATATESAAPAAAPAADRRRRSMPRPTLPSTPAPEAAPDRRWRQHPFEASKGLPADVVNAYESGDVVVLLVMQKKGFEDEALKRDVESLECRDDTSRLRHGRQKRRLAEYSADRRGCDARPRAGDHRPAPARGQARRRARAAPMPAASVSYGYRGKESVIQAVNDALYEGEAGTYAP